MPELPDVEHWRRYTQRYASGHRVETIHVLDADILRNTSPQGLGRSLTGRTAPSAERHGKWLILPFEPSPLVLHFGMTGRLAWSSHRSGNSAPGDAHPHDRLQLLLDHGALTYRAQRKLGGVWLARDGVEAVTGPLGPDAGEIARDDFHHRFTARRGGIKSALMDQELIAGVGNELSDETLWRARVAPARPVADLSNDQLDAVFDALRDVLAASNRTGHIPTEGRFVNAVRHDDEPGCPRCGARMEKERVAGRTAVWCRSCQDGG